MKSAKSESTSGSWLKLTGYSLTVLLSVALISKSTGATPKSQDLQIAQQSATTQKDANRAAAEKAEQEAYQLSKQNAPYLTKIIPKFEEALKYWRLAGDRKKEAKTLDEIAKRYWLRGEYPKALEYANKALPICQAIGDKKCEGEVIASMALIYEEMGEYQKAIEKFQQAPSLFAETLDMKPISLLKIARIYAQLGERQKAFDSYNQALDFWKAKGDVIKQAETLDSIAVFYYTLGEINKSFEILKQANTLDPEFKGKRNGYDLIYLFIKNLISPDKLASLKKPPQIEKPKNSSNQSAPPNSDASTNNNIEKSKQEVQKWRAQEIIWFEADVLGILGFEYYRIGEYSNAINSYKEALKLRQIMGNKPQEAKTNTDIANILNRQGKKQEAIDYLNKALAIQRQIKNRRAEADTLETLGDVYLSLGAYPESLRAYEQALSLSKNIGDRDDENRTLTDIAQVYRKLQDYPKALNYYQQALSISQTTRNCYGEALSLIPISRNHLDSGDYQKAISSANQALTLSQNFETYELKLATEAGIFNIRAQVEIKQGNYSQALEDSQKARKAARESGYREIEGRVIGSTAEAYAALKQSEKAIQSYQEQLALYTEIGLFPEQAQSLYNIAKLQRQNNQLSQALTQVDKSIKIIENIRKEVVSQDLRTSFFATVQDYYQLKIDILMDLHKKDPSKGYDAEALHTSERSRARGLIELLTEANADIRKGVDPKLLAEERRLRWRLDAQTKLLQEPKIQKTEEVARRKEIDNLLNQQKELQTKIRQNNPKYAGLQYPEPLKLPQIQQQLDKDTLLLQYFVGKEHSYLWAVTPNSLDSYQLPTSEAIGKSALNFKELLKECQKPGVNCQKLPKEQQAKDLQEITQAATEVSKLILAPVANKLGNKRLVIVANGTLQEIPFAALSEPNQQSNYQPLIVNHEIVNLPSVTAIATHRRDLNNRPPAPKTLAVLADPVFAANDERLTGKPPSLVPEINLEQSTLQQAAKDVQLTIWNRLPGTRTEAEQILKLVPPSQSTQAVDFDANYNFATSPKLKQYRFLLFATHGFADPENPESSGIVLSQFNQQGKQYTRSTLLLGDIFNLDWNADLVVLSACETGVGKDVQGEGLMGLTRGLMYAGAKTAVVSLWQVNDSATSELMPQFYTAMFQQKVSPIVALRESQLKLWREGTWQNPYYWAAFTLQGEWRN